MSDKADKQCFKLIFDEPATADAFASKGHERSAKLLTTILGQLQGRDGAIGLEGGWGSGKSTIVNIAEKMLGDEKGKEYYIYTFDLWVNKIEVFRKAFLEEFLAWADNKNIIKKTVFERLSRQIKGKTRITTQKQRKKYNLFGIFFLVFAPLLPILYAWLSPFAFRQGLEEAVIFGMPATSFALYTLVFLYGLLVANFIKELFFGFRTRVFFDILSRSVSMFSSDTQEETTTQNISENNPTAIEFHEIFRKLLGEVQTDSRKVIFVLDNIDRLPKEAAIGIWSEIRALYTTTNSKLKKDIDNNVIAIVPYDREFLCDIFEITPEPDKKRIKNDLFDKTFDYVISVSPPILADWKHYLYVMLDRAISIELSELQKFNLFKLLSYFFQTQGVYPAPRTIVKFVNSISQLYGVWHDYISIEAVAVYTFHEQGIKKSPKSLLRRNLVDNRYIRIAQLENWQRDFAALAFNVSPEEANQVLLSQPIALEVTRKNTTHLEELSQSPGFNEILSDVLHSNCETWASEDCGIISNIVENINNLNKLRDEVKANVWEELSESLKSIKHINYADASKMKNLSFIINSQKSEDPSSICLRLVKIINQSFDKENDDMFAYGQDWYGLIAALVDNIDSISDSEKKIIQKNLVIPNFVEFALGVAYKAYTRDRQKIDKFNLQCTADSIAKELVGDINSNTDYFIPTYKGIPRIFNIAQKVMFAEACSDKLNGIETDIDDRVRLLEILSFVFSDSNFHARVEKVINSLFKSGTLSHSLYLCQKANKKDGSALAVWLLFTAQNKISNIPSIQSQHAVFGNITATASHHNSLLDDKELYQQIKDILPKYISRFESFSRWMNFAISDKKEDGIFKEVFTKVIDDNTFGRLNVRSTISQYKEIRRIVGEDLALKFLNKFSNWSGLFSENIDEDDALDISPLLIYDIAKCNNKRLDSISDIVDDRLKRLSSDEWMEAFKNGGNILELLAARVDVANLTVPANQFRPPLTEYIVNIITDKTSLSSNKETWGKVLNALRKASQAKMANDVFMSLSSNKTTLAGLERFVMNFGEISKIIKYSQSPDLALNQIFSELILTEVKSVREFVRNNVKEIRLCIRKSNKEARGFFYEIIDELDGVDDSSKQLWSDELSNMFKY